MEKKPRPRRAGQIRPAGKDKWMISVFRGRDGNGKKKYQSKVVKGTRKEAEGELRKLHSELQEGTFVKPSLETLDVYLDRWLEVARTKLAFRTFEDYRELLARYVRPALGHMKLSSLKPPEIQALYSRMLTQGLSSRTVRMTDTILGSALKQALRWGLITNNPTDLVELPRKERREMKALTQEEAKRFLEVAQESPYGLLFWFALETGMRPEEYLGLKWKDIDFDRGLATVRRTLCWKRRGRANDGENGWYFGEPKTARSRRSLPLSDPLLKALLVYKGSNFDPEEIVFQSITGGPLISDNLSQRHFKPLLKNAGLPKIRLYDLRHTMATLLLLAGENPKIVSERLGHASVVLTLDTYSHILPGMQEGATKKLQEMLFGHPD